MLIDIVVVDIGGNVCEELIANLKRRAAENDEIHRHIVFCEKLTNGVYGDSERLIFGVAVNARGDQRKSYSFTAIRLCQRKASSIARGELFALATLTAVPYRADGVNHIFARQTVRARYLGVASLATAECLALA